MKKLNKMTMFAGLLFSAATLFTSCKKDEPVVPTVKNIAETVASDPNFSLLNQAVTKAGLASALSSGSLTVFAPDNAAFAAAGITSTTINTLTATQVADLLKYHVVGAKEIGRAHV